MKTGFYLAREPFLKVMGSLADESLARGHSTVLYCPEPGREMGDKAYQALELHKLDYFLQKGAQVVRVKAFSDLLTEKDLDVLFVLEGYHHNFDHFDEISRLRKAGTKVVSLMHFFETCQWPLQALDWFDLTVYPSEYARDIHFDIQGAGPEEKTAHRRQYVIGGEPVFDQIGNFSRGEARQNLGLNPEDRMVLLFSPPMTQATPWRYYVWRETNKIDRAKEALRMGKLTYLPEIVFGSTFADVSASIRQFCERNGASLFVKSRFKHKDPAYLVAAADRYMDGSKEEYYPAFTTYQLLAAADLCIAVNSMAGAEAVALGIPCVNIYAPHLDFAEPLNRHRISYYEILLNGAPDSLMNYQGCITNVHHKRFPDWLAAKHWGDFLVNSERRKKYLQTFFGVSGEPANKRILDICEKVVSSSASHTARENERNAQLSNFRDVYLQ